jgi:hypothetical protein
MPEPARRVPNDITLMRPHWYDSDEENAGSEYDSEDEPEAASPTSVTWTANELLTEVREYLEDNLIDCEELMESQTMALGTWSILDDNHILSIKLNISAFLKWGAFYSTHFGYLHERWNEERPYDIMKVYCVMNDGFIDYRVVVKTHWLRLVQRHWKNRELNSGLKGLMSGYKIKLA